MENKDNKCYPLEFQKLKKKDKKKIEEIDSENFLEIKFYASSKVNKMSFYKPISKIINLEI